MTKILYESVLQNTKEIVYTWVFFFFLLSRILFISMSPWDDFSYKTDLILQIYRCEEADC